MGVDVDARREPSWRRGLLPFLLLTLVAGAGQRPRAAASATPTAVSDLEQAFSALRDGADDIALRQARGEAGQEALLAGWRAARAEVLKRLAAVTGSSATSLTAEDRAATAEVERALASELRQEPGPGAPAGSTPACDYDAAGLARQGGAEGLAARIYACYGQAAASLVFEGRSLDRLTILGELGTTTDPERRRGLFLALQPVWRSVNGDGGPGSPFRRLLALRAAGAGPDGLRGKAESLGLEPQAPEQWIVAILEAWREQWGQAAQVEPWDFYFENGAASRALGSTLPDADALRSVNDRFYRDLGADVSALGVRFDLAPRPGKDPVAFTTFGRRGRLQAGAWRPTEAWVFATYRVGGLDNLGELLHETGHAVHLAAIRTRPAFMDWPDDDTFTEAVADLVAADVHEPDWQARYLGAHAGLAEGLRARYAGIAMDAAWSLFELRLQRDPTLDPSRVWSEITSSYLGIAPHPEWSWWAMRGQLIDAPGYLANYAVGAVLTADLRARTRELRGATAVADAGWYAWTAQTLLRFGRARPARDVLYGFLGRRPSPAALLADLARARPPAASRPRPSPR